jgi:hypothetical protein
LGTMTTPDFQNRELNRLAADLTKAGFQVQPSFMWEAVGLSRAIAYSRRYGLVPTELVPAVNTAMAKNAKLQLPKGYSLEASAGKDDGHLVIRGPGTFYRIPTDWAAS